MTHYTRTLIAFLPIIAITASNLLGADTLLRSAIPLETPRKKPPRQGGPLDKVELAMWIPEGVKVVRGAIVNPFYIKTVEQTHWRAAARHWQFAIIGANYADVKTSDFPTLLKALKDFSQQSGHAEIEHLPFCFVGMSAGAGMSTRFSELMPERVIAVGLVCLEVGPRDEASRKIPMITVFGERDGRQMEQLAEKLGTARKEHALWATAVQWRRKHEFGRANNLLMPFFDRVIKHRYPSSLSPVSGVPKLIGYEEQSGWFGDPSTWASTSPRVVAFLKFEGEHSNVCWFPDCETAEVWRAFVSKQPALKITSPKGLGDGNPFQTYPASKPLEVSIQRNKDLATQQIELFHGDQKLGKFSQATGKIIIKLPAGIHALIAIATDADGEQIVSLPNTIVVSAD